MRNILVALAVASTLVAPAAMADTSNVTVYGQVNVSLDMVKTGATTNSVSANQVNSNESRLGFKGSEDLGGGLTAVFQVESGFNADGTNSDCTASTTSTPASGVTSVDSIDCSNDNAIGSRDTYAGVKSDAGTVVLGRLSTPYKTSTRGLDVFAGGIADNRSLMGMGHDTRVTDTIAYMSPSMSGFSVAAAYAMGAEDASASTDTKGKGISIAAMYDMAPFYATVAHQKMTYGTAGGQFNGTTGNSDKALKFGGSYKTDMFAVNAVIENVESLSGGSKDEVQNLYLSGQYNISGNDSVKVAYTKSGDWETNGVENTDTGATQVSLGYDHSLSKRTTVYALWTKLSNKANINYSLEGDSTNGPANGGNNSDPSAFSFGMKHSF